MAKQNKVAKLLKTLAVSSLCMAMIFPVGIINASSQNSELSQIQEETNTNQQLTSEQKSQLKSQEQNLLNQIQTKINSHGGLLKITSQQLKTDIDSVIYFNSKLANKLFQFEMSTKNFDKSVKSKGGYKNLTLVQIRAELTKYFAYDHDLQDKLFYEIRSQLLSSRSVNINIGLGDHPIEELGKVITGWVGGIWGTLTSSFGRRWSQNNLGIWYYCNAYGHDCAQGFWRLRSSHHYVNGHRDNGYRIYYFHHGTGALRYTRGWWNYQGHRYFNDDEFGMYTNETYKIGSHNYHFDTRAYSHQL